MDSGVSSVEEGRPSAGAASPGARRASPSTRSWLGPGRALGHGCEGCVPLEARQPVPSGRTDGPPRSARTAFRARCTFAKRQEKTFLNTKERELTCRKSWEVQSSPVRRQIFLISTNLELMRMCEEVDKILTFPLTLPTPGRRRFKGPREVNRERPDAPLLSARP